MGDMTDEFCKTEFIILKRAKKYTNDWKVQ